MNPYSVASLAERWGFRLTVTNRPRSHHTLTPVR